MWFLVFFMKKGCIKKDHLGSRRAIMTLLVTLCVLLLLLPLSKTCSCTYHIGPVSRNRSLRFILFDESFTKRKRRSLVPTRWYDFKHQKLDLWWDGLLIVILIENWCSMHLGWFRMKDNHSKQVHIWIFGVFQELPPKDDHKNSGIWNLQKITGSTKVPKMATNISKFSILLTWMLSRQSTERLRRLQTVELLRELVGLKEATSGRDSILPTPETNSKFTLENGWLEYSFPFWDGANCYFQGM